MVAEIVDVHTQRDHRVVTGCDRRDDVHQFGLAVEATVGVVAAVGRSLHLERLDRFPGPTEFGSEIPAVGFLCAGERGRDRSDRGGSDPTEHLMGNRSQEGRVCTARERHHDRLQLS